MIIDGCKVARNNGYFGLCLECPFPKCLYDISRKDRHDKYSIRNRHIKADWKRGKNIKELVADYNLHYRTITRIINGK